CRTDDPLSHRQEGMSTQTVNRHADGKFAPKTNSEAEGVVLEVENQCDECQEPVDGHSALCEECSLDLFCRECGERNDNGEGSAGWCGNCADRLSCPECGDAVDEAGAVCEDCQA